LSPFILTLSGISRSLVLVIDVETGLVVLSTGVNGIYVFPPMLTGPDVG